MKGGLVLSISNTMERITDIIHLFKLKLRNRISPIIFLTSDTILCQRFFGVWRKVIEHFYYEDLIINVLLV